MSNNISNADLPQVHTFSHLPATREALEETTPNCRHENEVAPKNQSKDKATQNVEYKSEALPNYESGDEAIPHFESQLEIVSNFESDDETVPNFDTDDELKDTHIKSDDDLEDTDTNRFRNENTRIAFIQKVLAVKLLQLLGMAEVTFLLVANTRGFPGLSRNDEAVKLTVLSIAGFIVNNLVTFGLLYGRNDEEARSKNPFRYMFLVVYPLRLTAILIMSSMYFELLDSLRFLWIYYCVVVFVLLSYSIFAYLTDVQFNAKYGTIVAVGTQLVLWATTVLIFFYKLSDIIFVSCAAATMILEYIYILYDLKAMTSKNYWRAVPADFLDGAINLQMDYYSVTRRLLCRLKICFKK